MLLLGGQNKGLKFNEFIKTLDSNKVVKIVTFGEAGKVIYRLRKYNKAIKFYKEKTLYNLLNNIEQYLEGVDTVILSPGCASFDEFGSYVERGDCFKKMVLEYGKNYEKTNQN